MLFKGQTDYIFRSLALVLFLHKLTYKLHLKNHFKENLTFISIQIKPDITSFCVVPIAF